MSRIRVLILFLLSLVLLGPMLASCSNDDYQYPSVVEEFFSARTDAQGNISTIITDDGQQYSVLTDRTSSQFSADAQIRLIGYYALSDANEATLYSLSLPLSDQPAALPQYADSLPGQPVALQSIWAGGGYLNMVLNVKHAGGLHRFAFVDNLSEEQPNDGQVSLTLFHSHDGDDEAYTSRVYCSVPLDHYLDRHRGSLNIDFSYYGYDAQQHAVQLVYEP